MMAKEGSKEKGIPSADLNEGGGCCHGGDRRPTPPSAGRGHTAGGGQDSPLPASTRGLVVGDVRAPPGDQCVHALFVYALFTRQETSVSMPHSPTFRPLMSL